MVPDDQKNTFLNSEGDAWFRRNELALSSKRFENDQLFQTTARRWRGGSYAGAPRVLEVGCSNGYRLSWFKDHGFDVCGIDPSAAAVEEGRATFGLTDRELLKADAYTYFKSNADTFDFIIFGHSMYLMSPNELPRIVCGAIENLNEDGHVIIYDFKAQPHRRQYSHFDGLWSYKMNFAGLFTTFPHMKCVEETVFEHDLGVSVGNPNEDCALTVIKKVALKYAFPELAS